MRTREERDRHARAQTCCISAASRAKQRRSSSEARDAARSSLTATVRPFHSPDADSNLSAIALIRMQTTKPKTFVNDAVFALAERRRSINGLQEIGVKHKEKEEQNKQKRNYARERNRVQRFKLRPNKRCRFGRIKLNWKSSDTHLAVELSLRRKLRAHVGGAHRCHHVGHVFARRRGDIVVLVVGVARRHIARPRRLAVHAVDVRPLATPAHNINTAGHLGPRKWCTGLELDVGASSASERRLSASNALPAALELRIALAPLSTLLDAAAAAPASSAVAPTSLRERECEGTF